TARRGRSAAMSSAAMLSLSRNGREREHADRRRRDEEGRQTHGNTPGDGRRAGTTIIERDRRRIPDFYVVSRNSPAAVAPRIASRSASVSPAVASTWSTGASTHGYG